MQYRVTGMTCAACSARVEKAVSKVDGVTACSVSLLTNSMSVEGTASPESIVRAVSEAGYGAAPENKPSADESALENTETKSLVIRLCVSAFFLLILMWFSMGYTMWDFPVPTVLNDRPLTIGWIQFLLAAIVLCINQRFFVSGTKAVLHRAPNMDTLVALGSAASFLYSTAILIDMT
ncbi:MAG: cation-translocating P-type ATPase, partial [Clostridiales bacterium]|nr:cation-translocating P-type ATPase [Candidatus Coliplasma caballi]